MRTNFKGHHLLSVSIAMATYNGARFLREQLDSIARQTTLPAELVITDDGSADNSVNVIEQFARDAPFPVRLFRNERRLGYRANFMRAVGLCSGEIIALSDQDDVWSDGKLAVALRPFDDPAVLLCYHEAWVTDSAGQYDGLAKIYPVPARNPPLSLFPLRNPFGFSMLFRRSLLAFSDLWDRSVDDYESGNRMAHDQWFFFLASVFGTIAYVDEPLVSYRQHGNNTYGLNRVTHNFWTEMRQWIDEAENKYQNFSVAAATRAALLEAMQSRLDPKWRERAKLAVAGYRDLARHSALRSQAYASRGLLARLKAWHRLRRQNAYGARTRWAYGRKTALKELLYLSTPVRLARLLPMADRAVPSTSRNDPR